MFRNKAFYGVYRPGEILDDFPMAASDSLNEDQLSYFSALTIGAATG